MTPSLSDGQQCARLPSRRSAVPQISMCKRAVERYNNEPKRAKSTKPAYTQGPLDEVFGQHRAFPLETVVQSADDSEVYQYLASVRKEAENDQVCHFVDRVTKDQELSGAIKLPCHTQRGMSPLSKEYMDRIMDGLQSEKKKLETPRQEKHEGFFITDLDFTSDEARHKAEHEPLDQEGADTSEDQTSGENIRIKSPQPMSDIASLSFEIPESASKWRQLVFTSSPPPQEYFQSVLEHPTVIKLIVYYTKWLSGSIPDSLQHWIFATFVRLDCGLDHQELAIVRALGVKAKKIREKLLDGAADGAHISQVALSTMDMILAVVSQYFGQKDLIND